jgi:serine protease Do
MLHFKHLTITSLSGVLLSLMANPAWAALSIAEVNSIARQTTVLIAPGLTPELKAEIENNRNNPLAEKRNPEGVWNPGSGVIIAKQGKNYYVLTVAHNFFQRHLDTKSYWQKTGGAPYYGIRTNDGKIHVVRPVDDGRGCPLQGKLKLGVLLRFGCRDRFIPGTNTVDRQQGADDVKGTDLAIITFTSEKNYPVAAVGDANTVKVGDTVYISGWPDPEKELNTDTGKCRNKVARRQRRLAWGPVTGKVNPEDPQTLGYSIFYTDNTRVGMSGGPVFDRNGRVVGSHGQGKLGKPKCGYTPSPESGARLESEANTVTANSSNFSSLQKQFSSSQSVNFFLNLINRDGVQLPFNLTTPSVEEIKKGLNNNEIKELAQASGKVEFDASADSLSDPKDVVDDIYKAYSFQLGNLLRDCPSGGVGSVLLGDRDSNCSGL